MLIYAMENASELEARDDWKLNGNLQLDKRKISKLLLLLLKCISVRLNFRVFLRVGPFFLRIDWTFDNILKASKKAYGVVFYM